MGGYRKLKIGVQNYNVPHFIGEFTLFENADSWDYGLQQFTETGSHWTTWTYKVMGRNNWGMYNSEAQNSHVADIASDDLNTINNKWSQCNTLEYFSPNPTVIKAMQKATFKSEKLAENSGDVAGPVAVFD